MLFGNFAESRSKDFGEETIEGEEFAEDYGYSSDSDLEDDEDGGTPWFTYASEWMVNLFNLLGVSREGRRTPCEQQEEHVEKGKVFKLPDMAFVT